MMNEQEEQQFRGLQIEESIVDNLPSIVKVGLSNMSQQKQMVFVEEYKRKRKSIGWAYFFHFVLFQTPYAYLGKWGLQILFWFTGCGVLIWWIVLLFTIPSMVKNYNKEVAIQITRDLQIMG